MCGLLNVCFDVCVCMCGTVLCMCVYKMFLHEWVSQHAISCLPIIPCLKPTSVLRSQVFPSQRRSKRLLREGSHMELAGVLGSHHWNANPDICFSLQDPVGCRGIGPGAGGLGAELVRCKARDIETSEKVMV